MKREYKCQYCGTEIFYYFDNGVMVMSNCKNDCIGSLKIYQYNDDEEFISTYWNWKIKN